MCIGRLDYLFGSCQSPPITMKEIIKEGFKVRFVCPMKLTILKTAVTSPSTLTGWICVLQKLLLFVMLIVPL